MVTVDYEMRVNALYCCPCSPPASAGNVAAAAEAEEVLAEHPAPAPTDELLVPLLKNRHVLQRCDSGSR